MSELKVYVHPAGEIDLADALNVIDDEWVNSGNCCDQTVIDLVNCLKFFMRDHDAAVIAYAAADVATAAGRLAALVRAE